MLPAALEAAIVKAKEEGKVGPLACALVQLEQQVFARGVSVCLWQSLPGGCLQPLQQMPKQVLGGIFVVLSSGSSLQGWTTTSCLTCLQLPFFVGTTAGTTVLGAYDPFAQVSEVCQRHGLWHHVDGCWGAAALLSPAHRQIMQGAEQADSLAWNPHKAMGLPLQCSAFLTRHPGGCAHSSGPFGPLPPPTAANTCSSVMEQPQHDAGPAPGHCRLHEAVQRVKCVLPVPARQAEC